MVLGMTIGELVRLLLPFIVLEFALKVYCLFLLVRDEPNYLPRWAWAAIILVVATFGSIGYLILGRKRD